MLRHTDAHTRENARTHLGEWCISSGLTWLNTCIIFWAALCCWISFRDVKQRLIIKLKLIALIIIQCFPACVLRTLTLKQSCSAVLPWKYLCQARTTSGLKALTTYTRPGLSTSRSAQVHSTLQPRRRPPSREPSSLERGCSMADRPRDDQEETVLDSEGTSSRE